MKPRIASIIALLLALLVASLGFAGTGLLVCHNQCEQNQVAIPPCCSATSASHHGGVQGAATDDADCPHLDNGSRYMDFSFTVPVTTVQIPPAAYAGPLNWHDFPLAASLSRSSIYHRDISPHLDSPPRYHLYCSLLI